MTRPKCAVTIPSTQGTSDTGIASHGREGGTLGVSMLYAAVLAALAGCAPADTTAKGPVAAPYEQEARQPANVGDTKLAALHYHNSGQYAADVQQVATAAQAWIEQDAPHVHKPAIVLDVDETVLSNWDMTRADDFGYFPKGSCDRLPAGPCGAEAWEMSGKAPALAPMLALYTSAQARGVSVFFVTGRREVERASTTANLQAAGYTNFVALYLKPNDMKVASAADYKTPVRKAITDQGYTIVANIGDQPSDLSGGYADKAFLLPNPFYRVP